MRNQRETRNILRKAQDITRAFNYGREPSHRSYAIVGLIQESLKQLVPNEEISSVDATIGTAYFSTQFSNIQIELSHVGELTDHKASGLFIKVYTNKQKEIVNIQLPNSPSMVTSQTPFQLLGFDVETLKVLTDMIKNAEPISHEKHMSFLGLPTKRR